VNKKVAHQVNNVIYGKFRPPKYQISRGNNINQKSKLSSIRLAIKATLGVSVISMIAFFAFCGYLLVGLVF